jgi:hypothetical protein
MKLCLPSLLLFLVATQCFGSDVDITTTTLPNGTVDTEYSATIKTSGGCAPYVWSRVSGSLPPGITAQPSSSKTSLILTGKPDKEGAYIFVEEVTACGHDSKHWYKIVIQAAANHVVDLNWKASTTKDVAGYNVYRAPDGVTWKKINSSLIASTLYDDSTVANGSTYYYSATSVDISGHESSKTAAVKVVVP